MSKITDIVKQMHELSQGSLVVLESDNFDKEKFLEYVRELSILSDQEVSEIKNLAKSKEISDAAAILQLDSRKILKIASENDGILNPDKKSEIKKFLYNIKKLDEEIGRYVRANGDESAARRRFRKAINFVAAPVVIAAFSMIGYELFGPRDLNIGRDDVNEFKRHHSTIVQKIDQGKQLTLLEKKQCIDWLATSFSKKGFAYSAKYLQMYIHPDTLRGNSKMLSWNAKTPGTYPVYNITPDWNNEGFNSESLVKIIREARSRASNPEKILKILDSGGEALLLYQGKDFTPLEVYAMENFSFYAQKGEAGKIIIRVKDIYDFRAKQLFFKIDDDEAEKIIDNLLDDGKLHKYSFGVYYLDDSFWVNYGAPYIMIGEWEVDEGTFYKYFSN